MEKSEDNICLYTIFHDVSLIIPQKSYLNGIFRANVHSSERAMKNSYVRYVHNNVKQQSVTHYLSLLPYSK